jgi:hypothetical protein
LCYCIDEQALFVDYPPRQASLPNDRSVDFLVECFVTNSVGSQLTDKPQVVNDCGINVYFRSVTSPDCRLPIESIDTVILLRMLKRKRNSLEGGGGGFHRTAKIRRGNSAKPALGVCGRGTGLCFSHVLSVGCDRYASRTIAIPSRCGWLTLGAGWCISPSPVRRRRRDVLRLLVVGVKRVV